MEADVQFYAFLSGTLIPILVALVTKARASSAVKGVVNALLSSVAGVVVTAAEHELHLDVHLGVAIFYAWVASVGTYFGLLRKTVTPAVANATANVGVG